MTAQLRFRHWGTAHSGNPLNTWYVRFDHLELAPTFPLASATPRNDAGGTNPDMLSVPGPPAVDPFWAAVVNLSVSGHGCTQIHGYARPPSVSGGVGKVVRIDLTHPGGEALATSSRPALPP